VDIRKSKPRELPWFLNIDYTKPLLVIAGLIILYLMIAYYDIWIPRLLTSNTRVQHSIKINEEKLNERHNAPQTSTTKDSSLSSDEDDVDDDNDDNNDQTSTGDNDDDSPVSYNKHNQQKLNIRIRRNKMSFSKDRPTKKKRGSLYQATDDDDDDVNLDADADDEDLVIVDPTKEKVIVVPSSIYSSKKHHRSAQVREPKIKIPTSSKTNLILREPDDIVEQLQKLLKSRGKNRDLLATLTKETGLNKAKLNRFIHGKDYSIITLDALISFLNSFDSTLLIVPK